METSTIMPQPPEDDSMATTSENAPTLDSSTIRTDNINNDHEAEASSSSSSSPDERPEIQSESSHGFDKDTETQVTDVEEEEEGELLQSPTTTPSNLEEGIRHKSQPFVFDPNKLNIRFLFANHDGIDVTVICNPSDTIGQLKGQLLSLWPNEISQGSNITGDQLRLICMGKGVLGPDIKTISECGVPIFETHATPVNVSVRPVPSKLEDSGLKKTEVNNASRTDPRVSSQTATDACCIIL